MSVVYVPQEVMYRNQQKLLVPKFNIDKAGDYGKIEILLPYGGVALAPQPMIRKLKTALKDFSDDDFILPMGDPTAIGCAMAIAGDANNGRVQLLRWDRVKHDYLILKFNLKGGSYSANNHEEI